MILISIGAFFFQNNVLPIAQTKMWTLLYSARQKSPEMEIPEKAFYSQIPGISVYVERKDPLSGMLRDVMIYDMREGADKTRIIVADSGRISLTSDKTHLLLNLYTGEQFENLTAQTAGIRSNNMPYRRESFSNKDIVMPFDANFNRLDESAMRNQYVGKNISELNATIDSVQHRVDSINAAYGNVFKREAHFGIYAKDVVNPKTGQTEVVMPTAVIKHVIDIDSVLNGTAGISRMTILQQGLNRAQRIYQEYQFKALDIEDDMKTIRRHGIELQKKFTLSFAVIIFFFIGAPLGAIIRKGGFGMPLVISVFLFIIYYIIDNTGYKLARDGRLDVVSGMWLSSVILLPLGVFLTYKALHDSSVFNLDAYKAFFMRLVGKYPKRTLEVKEFTIDEVDTAKAEELLGDFLQHLKTLGKVY
ncbi:MAG: LptF/LptG family permease, partial [Muribaculaceae bacterium]|nr:LptF/LptG family permease [Muribaculaceae bacterium]